MAIFGREKYLRAGEVIFMAESEVESVVLVMEGTVKGMLVGESRSVFNVVHKGHVIGEANVVTGAPASYTMITDSNCKLLYIPRFAYLSNAPVSPPLS
jgi:CRP-like cAMP-binding protein